MKTKLILFFAAVLFLLTAIPTISNAQFSKGNILIEGGLGNLSLSNNKTHNEEVGSPDSRNEGSGFKISIFPRIGYFVTNNLVVGTTLGIGFSSNKSKSFNSTMGYKEYESKFSSATLDLLPFVRYYFPGKNIKTRLYGQIGGGVNLALSAKYTSENFDNNGKVVGTYKTNYAKKPFTVSGEALVGLNHFISQNVAVNAALGYNYSRSTMTSSYTQTFLNSSSTSTDVKNISTTGAFVWNVGFTMIIPCKKNK